MKRFVFVLFVLVSIGTALSQAFDFGVREVTDEFTGISTCFQRVDNSLGDDSGITLSVDEELGVIVWIRRHWDMDRDTWMFNSMSNNPWDEVVYIRFPKVEEVVTLAPDYIDVDIPNDIETAAWWGAEELAYVLTHAESDIRIRFSGVHGNKDFTINRGVLEALRAGFFVECVPLPEF